MYQTNRNLHATILLCLALVLISQKLEPLTKDIGSTLCRYLAFKHLISEKYLTYCGEPTCSWNDWHNAINPNKMYNNRNNIRNKNKRIIISYSHNGFGNQIWEHSVAFMIAEDLNAQLLVDTIPNKLLSKSGVLPSHTDDSMVAIEHLLPTDILYKSLAKNSTIRQLCDQESFFLSDRPIDWREKLYTNSFNSKFQNLIRDLQPRCLKVVGFFQNFPICYDKIKQLWSPKILANLTLTPGKNDISIYLRCLPNHYYFNDKKFYDTILSNTKFDKIWIFQSSICPNTSSLAPDSSKDNIVTGVIRLLYTKYNATRWPSYQSTDKSLSMLNDLAALSSSTKLILPVSSWAFWAGVFSNATEVHVNSYPHHPIMYSHSQYIYHDEKNKKYFGKWNSKVHDIQYSI